MKIVLDTDILNEYKLSPSQYVMLLFKYKDLPHQASPQIINYFKNQGLCTEDYELTDKALALFEEKTDLDDLTDEDFVTKLRDLFPKGAKTGGKPVRSAIGTPVIKKYKQFEKDYKYSRETVFKATQAYVADRKKDQYRYMKVFSYFINKLGEDSTLASWCEQINDIEINTDVSDGRITKTL